jgi:hypothetical protein
VDSEDQIANHVNGWVKDVYHPSRVRLARIGISDPNVRKKTLDALASVTPTRSNILRRGKERHFLLHRVVGKEEIRHVVKSGLVNFFDNTNASRKIGGRNFRSYTSWSPHVNCFNDMAGIVSAWIPESKIAVLPQVWSKLKGVDSGARGYMNDEHEVIVNPGRFFVHHHSVGSSPQRHIESADKKTRSFAKLGDITLPRSWR